MAVAQLYTAAPNDVITAARWNNEFGNIYNNGTTIAFPLTTAVSFNGQTITLDNAGANTLTAASGIVTLTSTNLRLTTQLSGVGAPILNEFRLSLTTATPVTTADVTGAGTIYLTPYRGQHISLYSGTEWVTFNTAQLSLVLTATSGKPYDVFVYSNAGTPTLETLVWTDDTNRATALAYQDGVLVKSGTATRRYVGSFYASGANTTEDSVAKRYLFNYYNRVLRFMKGVTETTDTWTYTTATWQQANANAANQIDFIVGVAEDRVEATAVGCAKNSTSSIERNVGVGLDSTTVNSAVIAESLAVSAGINTLSSQRAYYAAIVPAGRHTLKWLERSIATGAATWLGDNGNIYMQSGIWGELWA